MKYISIEELMVPLKDCDRLVETATLLDAVEAIDKAFSRPHPGRLPHRTLLVLGVEGGVVGLVGYLDVLRGLEPKYRDLIGQQGMAHLGFTPKFIKSMLTQYHLWEHPLDHICRKASNLLIRDFMYVPRADEFIRKDATLDEAVHQLLMGGHHALLVNKEDVTVGMLRLSDVYEAVADRIKLCRTDG
ncbi:MAG: CBS domain-containing protein [Desulfobacterales bacterium]